jgi:hypothetical protein
VSCIESETFFRILITQVHVDSDYIAFCPEASAVCRQPPKPPSTRCFLLDSPKFLDSQAGPGLALPSVAKTSEKTLKMKIGLKGLFGEGRKSRALKDRAGLQNAERRKEAMVLTLPCSCRAGT